VQGMCKSPGNFLGGAARNSAYSVQNKTFVLAVWD
jgi:hypothetical protein